MCRWHSMNRKEKCRCISLILVFLIGVGGVTAMIYGGVQMFRVSKSAAQNDGLGTMMSTFFNCHEIETPQGGPWDPSAVKQVAVHQCTAPQIPARITIGFAAAFMILALLCAPCAFKKDKWFGFTMWSTLAIATVIVAVTVVASQALPVAAQFADCTHYNTDTINEITQQYGAVCVKGLGMKKESALKWLCKLCTFFAGAGVSIGALLLMFMIKSCRCCNPNASCGQQQGCGTPAANGEHPCPIRRALHKFRSRFCQRSRAQEDLPVSAPTYYEASVSESSEGASEDAGSSSSKYYGVN